MIFGVFSRKKSETLYFANSNFSDIHIGGGGGGKLNLGLSPKIWEGERCKFGELLEKKSKL